METENIGKAERMADFFDKRAPAYDDFMKTVIEEGFYKQVSLRIAGTKERITILDLGCGTGAEIENLLERAPNAHIVCVDISRAMLEELARKYASRVMSLELVECSYLDYEFGLAEYDYVVSAMTMHHLDQITKLRLYARIRDSLKEGGAYIEGDYIAANDGEERTLREDYERAVMEEPAIVGGGYHFDIPLTPGHQQEVLEEAGFTDVSIAWAGEKSAVFVAR